jgi:gamma-glutamyltranspeptidase/glutathione hydrolase
VGFPDDAAVPAVGLASASYAAERRALIGGAVTEVLPPGDPWDEERTAADPACAVHEPAAPTTLPRPVAGGVRGGSPEDEEAQTTHLSVVDADRNAVSLTFTLGLYFGSGSYAAGAFFNSAVANFGGPEANRPGPDRTPRSTIAPTIVLDGDDVRLVVGSPGSQYIGPAIVLTILYTLEYGFDPFTALSMPRMLPLTNVAEVRIEGGIRESAMRELTRRGYTLDEHGPRTTAFGGVQVVLVRADGSLVGAADPRRDGGVAGY